MKILITGAGGYIGSRLCLALDEAGHEIYALDNLMYGQGSLLYNAFQQARNINFINHDVRIKIPDNIIKDVDYIIPLAAYVGEPICKTYVKYAEDVNVNSISSLLKKTSKQQRILFPNTNSSYGNTGNKICTEETPTNAISWYAKTKDMAEQIIMDRGNAICFRLATVFGPSPRQRWDLLVNTFIYHLYRYHHLEIFDAHYMRNFVSIRDILRLFRRCIPNFDYLKNEIYNFGDDNLNMTKYQMAKKIADYLKRVSPNIEFGISINTQQIDPDQRNYIVSSKKLRERGFWAKTDPYHDFNILLKMLQVYKTPVNSVICRNDYY